MISLIISSLTRIIFITISSIKVVLSRHDEVLCGIFLQIQPKKFQRKKNRNRYVHESQREFYINFNV